MRMRRSKVRMLEEAAFELACQPAERVVVAWSRNSSGRSTMQPLE